MVRALLHAWSVYFPSCALPILARLAASNRLTRTCRAANSTVRGLVLSFGLVRLPTLTPGPSIGRKLPIVRSRARQPCMCHQCGVLTACVLQFTAGVWRRLPWCADRALLCADCTVLETNSCFLSLFTGSVALQLFQCQAWMCMRMNVHL